MTTGASFSLTKSKRIGGRCPPQGRRNPHRRQSDDDERARQVRGASVGQAEEVDARRVGEIRALAAVHDLDVVAVAGTAGSAFDQRGIAAAAAVTRAPRIILTREPCARLGHVHRRRRGRARRRAVTIDVSAVATAGRHRRDEQRQRREQRQRERAARRTARPAHEMQKPAPVSVRKSQAVSPTPPLPLATGIIVIATSSRAVIVPMQIPRRGAGERAKLALRDAISSAGVMHGAACRRCRQLGSMSNTATEIP